MAGLRAYRREFSLIAALVAGLAVAGCGSLQRITSDPPPPIPPPNTSIVAPPLPSSKTQPAPVARSGVIRAPAAGSLSAPTSTEYRMGVGDKIRIQVHGEPDLTMELTISESGVINYPFLGDIPVRGRSVNDLQRTIDSGLRGDFLVNPDVRVVVINYRNFYINGEVRLPGGYPFVPGLTIRQAATLAGGFTERASMRGISVFREAAPTTKLPATLDTPVLPGDSVTVEQGLF